MREQLLNPAQAQRDQWMLWLGLALLGGAIFVLVATGVVGVGRSAPPQYDFALYYAGGLIWLEGGNPYDVATFAAVHGPLPNAYMTPSMFAYPPTFAPMAMGFALLSFETARTWLVIIDLVATGFLAWFTVRLVVDAREPRPASTMAITPWLVAALVVGNFFISRQIWLGQITPVAGALLVAAWYLVRREQFILAGVLLGLATIKPQFLVLPMLWLLLDRQWRTLFTAGAVGLLLAAYPFWVDGPVVVLSEWLGTLSEYEAHDYNRPGNYTVVGFPGLVAAATGIQIPVFLALGAAVMITVGLWVGRSRLHADDILGILLLLNLGLVYGRDYDLMYLAPAFAALWLHAAHRPKLWPWLGALLVLLFIPNRIMQTDAAPLLVQWLTPTVLLILATLLVLSFRPRPVMGAHRD